MSKRRHVVWLVLQQRWAIRDLEIRCHEPEVGVSVSLSKLHLFGLGQYFGVPWTGLSVFRPSIRSSKMPSSEFESVSSCEIHSTPIPSAMDREAI